MSTLQDAQQQPVEGVYYVWFTALNSVLVFGDDIAAGEVKLREHYEREGYSPVAVLQPWTNNTPRDHGYRRVFAIKPAEVQP